MNRDKTQVQPITVDRFLRSRPFVNRTMTLTRRPDGTAMAAIPMRRPRWLVAPLSWILPYSSDRRVELDKLGLMVLDMCDGKQTVEDIMEKFAAGNRLSFREAQLAVTQFLRALAQRGLLAIVGADKN